MFYCGRVVAFESCAAVCTVSRHMREPRVGKNYCIHTSEAMPTATPLRARATSCSHLLCTLVGA
eukprot:487628-Amphidinium_carterae.1